MTVRQHWICAGIALAALYVGLFAGRWYAEHRPDHIPDHIIQGVIFHGDCRFLIPGSGKLFVTRNVFEDSGLIMVYSVSERSDADKNLDPCTME